MLNTKLIALACLSIVTGLMVGLLSFRDEFQAWSSYTPMSVDVTHVYLQVLNVSQDSGIVLGKMVAKVFVLNITNPTDKIYEIREIMIYGEMQYYRDFEVGHSDYYWHPGDSRQVAFTSTDVIGDEGISTLNSGEVSIRVELFMGGLGEQTGVHARCNKKLDLTALGNNEFVYSTEFKADNQFWWHSGSLDILDVGANALD